MARPPEGVTRPLTDMEEVARPVFEGREGVVRPREEATEEGRGMGADSLAWATKTPPFGAQEKYWTLAEHELCETSIHGLTHPLTAPSFFPRPAKPGLSSTPAQTPGFPSIGPKYRNMPSIPKLSMRTTSSGSNVRSFPRALALALGLALDCRLSGRDEVVGIEARGVNPAIVVRVAKIGVLGGAALELIEEDAAITLVEFVIIFEGRGADTRLDCAKDDAPD